MTTGQAARIDELMELASKSLTATHYFEAERAASRALHLARKVGDFDRLARICLPLQESRRQRLLMALDAGDDVRIIDEPFDDSVAIEPGCYLVQPPLVAVDARRLRTEGLRREVPIAVLCREPMTRLRLLPVVALGAVVIRTRIDPPEDLDHPDKQWFIEAMEALGDAAIEAIDPALQGERRVDALLDRLDAFPDHEKLHQRLEESARETARLIAMEQTEVG